MANKQMSAAQVVAQMKDGMTVGIGGWGPRRKPMALVREILRSPLKDLTVVAYGGADVGMLCAAGKVKKLVFAFVSLDFIPLEPYFRMARQSGALEVMEVDEGLFMLGLKAAGMRVPYIPTRVGLGTDVLKRNPGIKLTASPYDDKDWVAMPALPLDVALLHVERAAVSVRSRALTFTWTICSHALRGRPSSVVTSWWTAAILSKVRKHVTCTGSARRPPVWCICPVAPTPVRVRRCMVLMSNTSRSMWLGPRMRPVGSSMWSVM
jgi:acyl CoA:acetate/3-ketoacid CoA transferase alpha subunit